MRCLFRAHAPAPVPVSRGGERHGKLRRTPVVCMANYFDQSADPCTLRLFFSVCGAARSVSLPPSRATRKTTVAAELRGLAKKHRRGMGFAIHTSRNPRSPAPRSIRGIRQSSKTRDCVFSGHRPTPFRRNSARALARRSLQNGRQRPGGLRDAAAGAAEAARPRELLVALDEEE